MTVKIIEADTLEERIERKLSYFDHLPKYIERGKYLEDPILNNIEAIVTRPEGDNTFVKHWYYGHNIVTQTGNTYYAQRATGGNTAVTNDFGHATNSRCYLRTASDTPVNTDLWENVNTPQTSTGKAPTSGYPKQNDGDTDNAGRGIYTCTYCYNWTTGDFNLTGLQGGAITATSSPTTGTPLLTHFSITSFDKTSTDTLKLFINHTFAGQ